MELDKLKQTIQEYFQEDTVTIVGSGLSSAEGLPGMKALSGKLMEDMPQHLSQATDISQWNKIQGELRSGKGLEEVLHQFNPSHLVEQNIQAITAKYIRDEETKIITQVITNGRVLRFSEYLDHFTIRGAGLTVITTNYDRLIEYACEYRQIEVDTLFRGTFYAHFSPETSQYAFCNGLAKVRRKQRVINYCPKVTVLKPHGSLNWYIIHERPYLIPGYESDDCLIITPGINKYKEGYNIPFDTHRGKANHSIDLAPRYIIIGYGFNDDHLETHLVQQLKDGKSALIITRSVSQKTLQLIAECKNIIAICADGDENSRVITWEGNELIKGVNMWDLREMLREVF